MKALLDMDILVYRVGFTTQEVDVGVAQWRMDDLVNRLLEQTSATSYQGFLTESKDKTAYRQLIYPQYKLNRKAPRPVHYTSLREHLVSVWGAIIVKEIEADDAIGIASVDSHPNTIVSIDKDLLQIAGLHYNFVKEEFTTVDKEGGNRFFYHQMLTGDKADNVKGIHRCGPVGAENILVNGSCEEEWFNLVRNTYNDDDDMFRTGEALWILKEPRGKATWGWPLMSLQLETEETGQKEGSALSLPVQSEVVSEDGL